MQKMKKVEINPEIIWQFIKFCLVGVSNTAVDFMVYIFLTRIFHLFFILANIIAFTVACTWSFFINKRWTFKYQGEELRKRYLTFYIANVLGITIQTSMLYFFTRYFGYYDLYAKFIGVGCAAGVTFSLSKFWVFGKR